MRLTRAIVDGAAGYGVANVRLGDDNLTSIAHETFASGWLLEDGETTRGRPVDVEVMPDGALLISDDFAGDVYRIAYDGDGGGNGE